MTVTLSAEKREVSKKTKALLAEGLMPGVVYGPKQPAMAVSLSKKEFDRVFKEAGESTIIELSGVAAAPMQVLVKEVVFAPTKGGIVHVDFYAIEKGKKITATIPLHLMGEAPAAKAGGVINHVLHEVEVECMPNDLPSHIDVDISGLAAIEDRLLVSDLKVGRGVEILTGAEEVVVVVGEPAAEEEAEPVADLSTIEVEQKGKTEEQA